MRCGLLYEKLMYRFGRVYCEDILSCRSITMDESSRPRASIEKASKSEEMKHGRSSAASYNLVEALTGANQRKKLPKDHEVSRFFDSFSRFRWPATDEFLCLSYGAVMVIGCNTDLLQKTGFSFVGRRDQRKRKFCNFQSTPPQLLWKNGDLHFSRLGIEPRKLLKIRHRLDR